MRNKKYCIGITSVGSGIGQSIITSCNLSKLPITTVGLGSNPLGYGAYDCMKMDYLPTIYASEYVDELIKKCIQYNIDLIIPGLDDEALILSENINKISDAGLKVIVSGFEFLKLVRDKERMCQELTPVADIFVKSYDFETLKETIDTGKAKFPLIAKPRKGFASKGIEIILSEDDFYRITQDHIIQELAIPRQGDPFRESYLAQISKGINPQTSEISVQVVTDRKGDVIGKMASYNKLKNGVPIEIIPYESDYVWSEINKLIPTLKELGHKGPLNIQGRWTDDGLKIFEMNARFTGITGLRAIMGFNEVESCIKEWLDIDDHNNPLKLNYGKFGIRQTADKAVSLSNNDQVQKLSQVLNNNILKPQKTILLTGAGGYLGQNLIKELIKEDYEILAFDLNKETIKKLFAKDKNVTCYDQKDFDTGILTLGLVDILIHCGFARPYKSNEQIADSLSFAGDLFAKACLAQIPVIINISSQSVYGSKQTPLWAEDTKVMPESAYAQAKYAAELMCENIHIMNKQSFVTSLRLATLAGGQNGLVPIDVISKLVKKALREEPITIIGGQQEVERLDVRDAINAIISLLKTDYRKWDLIYNLGNNKIYNIMAIAEKVATIAREKYGKSVTINVNPSDIDQKIGMNSSKFRDLTGWSSTYNLDDTIISLFDYFKKSTD